jgi:integrase
VERCYDLRTNVYVEPESKAGKRRVPVPAIFRDVLVERRMNGSDEGRVFVRADGGPFSCSAISERAKRFWKAAGFDAIGLLERRRTCASVWIAAGVNVKAITTFMGHANIATTYDLYDQLMPGGESDALILIDACDERATD